MFVNQTRDFCVRCKNWLYRWGVNWTGLELCLVAGGLWFWWCCSFILGPVVRDVNCEVQQQDYLVQRFPNFTPHGTPMITICFPTDHFFLKIKQWCLKTVEFMKCVDTLALCTARSCWGYKMISPSRRAVTCFICLTHSSGSPILLPEILIIMS
jgi:hypothetical protein